VHDFRSAHQTASLTGIPRLPVREHRSCVESPHEASIEGVNQPARLPTAAI
jgi:hypothetical protein